MEGGTGGELGPALVTGGSRGIGRAIAIALAERGAPVAFTWRSDEGEARATEAALAERGAHALALRADLADPEQAARAVHRAEQELGPLGALVHAAGTYRRVPILEETPEGFRSALGDDLESFFHVTRLVAPLLARRGRGRILGFSIAGAEALLARPELPAHYVAKVGVLALVRAWAKALGPSGVTVNALSPGYVDTGGAAADELERARERIPAGRLGLPEDVVGAALFLLSDEAAYVNGANLVVSGGWGV
jgi:3-oxoacyl-[acyl-carrier protein] reductase